MKAIIASVKCVCHFHSIYLVSYVVSNGNRFWWCLLVELSVCLQLQCVCILFYTIYPFTWLQTIISEKILEALPRWWCVKNWLNFKHILLLYYLYRHGIKVNLCTWKISEHWNDAPHSDTFDFFQCIFN